MDTLLSQRDGLQAQIKSVALDIDKSTLEAPFSGTVLERYVHKGVSVQPAQRIARLQQAKIDEVHIGVPPQFRSLLAVGQCYPIIIDAVELRGCVDQVLSKLSDKTQTMRVIFALPEDMKQPVLSSQIARLTLQQSIHKRGAWVPLGALAQGMRGTWLVYRLIPTDTPTRAKVVSIPVQVISTQGEKAYIQGSFSNGDVIVKNGLRKFVPGQTVEVLP